MRSSQAHVSKLIASLGLMTLAIASLPAHAEEQRLAALSRTTIAMPALVGGEAAVAAPRDQKAAKAMTAKPTAANPVPASPAAQKDIYERELWRHQSAS